MDGHIKIPAVAPRIQYAGDGVQTAFAYPFPIFAADDLLVHLDDLAVASGFTVAGAGQDEGGTVTFAEPPAAGVRVTLQRLLAIRRTTDFQEGGAFRANTLNDELDYQTAALQQVELAAGRALRLGPTDGDAETLLPSAGERALRFLAFDGDGRPIASQGPPGASNVPVSAFMEGVLPAADAAAARAALGVSAADAETAAAGIADDVLLTPAGATAHAEAYPAAGRRFRPQGEGAVAGATLLEADAEGALRYVRPDETVVPLRAPAILARHHSADLTARSTASPTYVSAGHALEVPRTHPDSRFDIEVSVAAGGSTAGVDIHFEVRCDGASATPGGLGELMRLRIQGAGHMKGVSRRFEHAPEGDGPFTYELFFRRSTVGTAYLGRDGTAATVVAPSSILTILEVL